MRIMLLSMLSITFFSSNGSTLPEKVKPQKTFHFIEPCSATITDNKTFYVYNCNGATYTSTITSTCTKTAPTCTEASAAAVNCADAQMNTAAGAWKKNIRETNCPDQMIDWID